MRVLIQVCGLVLAAAAAPGLTQAEPIYGLQGSDRILTFDSATPGSITSNKAIVGLLPGEVLIGLDLRPANDMLYSLSTSGYLYSLFDGGSAYSANLIGNIGVPLTGSNSGIDFIPVSDRLRIVNDGDQNLRINPNNAVSIVDVTINPSDLNLVGLAYTNNFAGTTTTALYGIDTLTGQLMRSTNPNGGSFVSVGSLGLGPIGSDARLGFDVSGSTGLAYLGLNDWLYTVNLTTGAATAIGSMGGSNIRGLTVAGLTTNPPVSVPEPTTWAMMIVGLAALAFTRRRRARRNQPGNR